MALWISYCKPLTNTTGSVSQGHFTQIIYPASPSWISLSLTLLPHLNHCITFSIRQLPILLQISTLEEAGFATSFGQWSDAFI